MRQTDSETREGFLVSERGFIVPKDSLNLNAKTKREVTICNLFVNHRLPTTDIANLLDEDRRNVILALIRYNIMYDRRHTPGIGPLGKERRIAPIAT